MTTRRADRRQGAWQSLQAERRAAPGPGAGRRERADPGDPRRGALAAAGPRLVGVRGVPHQPGRDDGRPRAAQARLPQADGATAALMPKQPAIARGFKKLSRPNWRRSRRKLPAGTAIELWWQDEARVGQKNTITRRWARRGTRPRAPHDQRTQWAYIFGAICPAKGKGAGLVMPWCDTQAMTEHLKEISAAVDPGAHAVLMLDQAGWHGSAGLIVPANVTLLPLPPSVARVEPGRERLAVHARQLAVEPDFHVLRRHRRTLLRRLEQARRSALNNHVGPGCDEECRESSRRRRLPRPAAIQRSVAV